VLGLELGLALMKADLILLLTVVLWVMVLLLVLV
jgi:hypothetical protein